MSATLALGTTFDPTLLDGISVYQDVLLAGSVAVSGVRDCRQRWRLIEPRLPHGGAILDVGSNFGWFGLKVCETRPACVVASVEADPRSALVQRHVLASHEQRRIALLTVRANARMLSRFARSGQRFSAALCLSVLHWMPDHRRFLSRLGSMTDNIFVEYPHPDEREAGSAKIRRQIGDIGAYLRGMFPERRVECLGHTDSHLAGHLPRPIWMVGRPQQSPALVNDMGPAVLHLEPLIENGLSWPPLSWWLGAMPTFTWECVDQLPPDSMPKSCVGIPPKTSPIIVTRAGESEELRQILQCVPESGICPPSDRWPRRLVRSIRGALSLK